MSAYHGKRTFSNYHYSHNQLSADNPFRYIGSTYDPFKPKVTNNPSQKYEVNTVNVNQKKQPLSPYERKTYNNNLNDNLNINESRPWSKTGSSSALLNNSYNIMNNMQYNQNQNQNNNKVIRHQQQIDHVGELFNYVNKDLNSYYSLNKNQNKNIDTNNKNQNENQNSNQSNLNLNEYNNILNSKSLRTPQTNLLKNNNLSPNLEDKHNNINNFSSSFNSQNKNRIFSPQNNNNEYNNKNDNNKNYNNNYNDNIPYLNNYNKYNNGNLFNNNNNSNYNKNEKINSEEKMSNIELSEYSEENCNSVKSYAYKENPNSTFRDYMEDKGRVIQNIKGDPNSSLFCLFDGHGGGDVSKFLQTNFYPSFKEMLPFDNVKENLISLFKKVDYKIKDSNFFNVGSTACIIYITKENGQKCLYSANIGDTRSLLITFNDYKRLSYDHRASDPSEYKRITDNGGIVFAGRVYGTLMLSRSFGDWELKPYGVSSEPYVTRINITDNDKYVVVASDGIWDTLEDNDVFMMSKNFNNSKEFCDNLVKKAMEIGSTDNISCFVIKLN